MRLFGRAYSSSCGVVLAAKEAASPGGRVVLARRLLRENGIQRAGRASIDHARSSFFVADELRRNAVPLEQLERMAIRKEYVHFGETRASTEVAP